MKPGTIERLKLQRQTTSDELDALRKRDRELQNQWTAQRGGGDGPALAAIGRAIEHNEKRLVAAAAGVQRLDAEIANAQSEAAALRLKMGTALLPWLVELVTLTPEAAAAVEPLLNQYNALVGGE